MLVHLILIASLSLFAPPVGDGTLVDVALTEGPFAWIDEQDVRRDESHLVLQDAAIVSARPVGGDYVVELRGEREDGEPVVTIDLGQGIRASLTPTAAGDGWSASLVGPGSGPGSEGGATTTHGGGAAFSFRVAVRGRYFQLFVDGTPGPFVEVAHPLPAGVVRVTVAGGAVSFDRARVSRSPWRDEVEVLGADAERLARLSSLPLTSFTLLEPLPARVDPEFRVAVAGEPTPITVRQCGTRRDEADVPLLEQALALAGVRVWMAPRLLEGPEGEERVVTGETPFGPFTVTDEPVSFLCDALIGCGREWPSLTLWDVEKDRMIDRTVPGGPMGRGIECRVPPGVTRMKLVLARPGQDSIEHEIVLRRE